MELLLVFSHIVQDALDKHKMFEGLHSTQPSQLGSVLPMLL